MGCPGANTASEGGTSHTRSKTVRDVLPPLFSADITCVVPDSDNDCGVPPMRPSNRLNHIPVGRSGCTLKRAVRAVSPSQSAATGNTVKRRIVVTARSAGLRLRDAEHDTIFVWSSNVRYRKHEGGSALTSKVNVESGADPPVFSGRRVYGQGGTGRARGIPVITPVLAEMTSPSGRAGDTLNFVAGSIGVPSLMSERTGVHDAIIWPMRVTMVVRLLVRIPGSSRGIAMRSTVVPPLNATV